MNHKDNLKIHGDETFDGPIPDRRCTDVLYLIWFVVANAAFIGAAVHVIFEGDPNRLSKGYDFRAEICGRDGLEEKRFMYFPDTDNLDMSLCIVACPYHFVPDYYCLYEQDHQTEMLDWPCWDTYLTKAYGFFCLPAEKEPRDTVIEWLDEPMRWLQRSAGDILLTWDVILAGILLSTALGMVYMLWFRMAWIMHCIVSISMFSCVGLIGFLAYLIWQAAQRIEEQVCDDYGPVEMLECTTGMGSFVFQGVAIFFGSLAVLLAIIIFFKRKELKVAIGIIKITAKPMGVMVQMFIFPILFVIFGLGVMSGFTASVIWTMSIGTIEEVTDDDIPGGEAKMLVFTEEEKYLLTFNVLMFLWWLAFLITLAEFVFSFAVCIWYFCREKSNIYQPLWRALKIWIRYHMGSVVLASMVFFVLKIPRKITKPLIGRLKRAKQNQFVRCMTEACCCCLEMHEALLKYLAPHSVTYLALFGDKFMTSARRGYYLLQRNKARVGLSTRSGAFVVTIMKLTIALSGTCFTYGWLLYEEKTFADQLTIELVSATGPAFFSFLICMFVGQIFGGAFGACLNSVASCASADEEMFTNEQRFMQEDLQDFLDLVDEAGKDRKVLKARGGKVVAQNYADDADIEDLDLKAEKQHLNPTMPTMYSERAINSTMNTDRSYAAGILSSARALGPETIQEVEEEETKTEIEDQTGLFRSNIAPSRQGDSLFPAGNRSSRPLMTPSGISGLSEIRSQPNDGLQIYRANNFYSPSVMTSQIAFQVPESDFDIIDDEKPNFKFNR